MFDIKCRAWSAAALRVTSGIDLQSARSEVFCHPSACQSEITIIGCPAVSCLQRMMRDIGLSMTKLLRKLQSMVRLSSVIVEARDDEDRLPREIWKTKIIGNHLRTQQDGTDEQTRCNSKLARRENCSTGISNGEYLFACDSGGKTGRGHAFFCKVEQLVGGYAEIRVAFKESEAVTIGKRPFWTQDGASGASRSIKLCIKAGCPDDL